MTRIVEAYIGEYNSGKSEVSINRAIDLLNQGRKVTLVDLDIVEPFYTLRPLKKELEAKGLTILAWETKETYGLGEAGNIIKPEMRWALRREGDIVLDIGYGVEGAKTLNLVEEKEKHPELRIYAVLNIGRPITADKEEIIEYVKSLGPVHGIINNSHLGNETDVQFIQEGARVIGEAARELGLPVIATTVDYRLGEKIGAQDEQGNPVRLLYRYMDRSFW
ncbi:MAG: hypothetical protein ACOWWO_10395 [Peptococcaceae bacterium]